MDYQYIRVLGEGAFSRVYLAEDGVGTRFACKVSRETKMLKREAEILSCLYHPLFPAYIDYQEREGMGRLVMEYIPGKSLGQIMRARGRLSPRQAMGMAKELTEGLGYLHERGAGILYRDLKPENIMVCEDGHIKLIDFGCASYRDAQDGAKVGTPGFSPPEQLEEGGIPGFYSDVYSLGKTLQSVMNMGGKCRFKRKKYAGDWGRGSVRRKPGREERQCRRRLERLVGEAAHTDPRRRPQDMAEVALILTGKRKKEHGVICEKNIWESNYKNSCSLPSI